MFERHSIHGQWSSRQMFILAAIGSAVGLGNIWKFPYLVGENGGGAFILVYLACVLIIGLPIMIGETLIGRRGRQSPVRSVRDLAYEAGSSGLWRVLGFIAMATGLLILAYYSVIAGWILAYLARAISGVFQNATVSGTQSIYLALLSDPEKGLAWHTLFMFMSTFVVARGVTKGLERAIKYLLPLLIVVLLFLLGYVAASGRLEEAAYFLFQPNFDSLTLNSMLVAMGHALLTLGLGVGAMIIYGAYLPEEASISRVTLTVVLADTVIAVLASLVVFSIVLTSELSATEGPGLIFQTLPVAFASLAGGSALFALFLVMLVLASLTSAIALLEPSVAWLVEKWGVTRLRAALLAGGLVWIIGIACLLSFAGWSFEFEFAGQLRRYGLFDILEILTASFMLPLGGLVLTLFVGWVLLRDTLEEELSCPRWFFQAWYTMIRFITPVAVVAIFLLAIGVL